MGFHEISIRVLFRPAARRLLPLKSPKSNPLPKLQGTLMRASHASTNAVYPAAFARPNLLIANALQLKAYVLFAAIAVVLKVFVFHFF